ncbi:MULTISPECIES: hypothetical protein [unclassified Streptomyces]|uniref:hypothetical protein n=1 Tax=unclassified Streptomyces TaxID=2593676 RepID=UPI003801FA5B
MGALEPYEYAERDAVGLRELIRAGEVTAAEVEAVARRALAEAGAELNALTLPLLDPAPAHAADGPLAGVPFVVKDGGPFVKGVPFTLAAAPCGAPSRTPTTT